jgi:outer membrane protein assembly factor BamB
MLLMLLAFEVGSTLMLTAGLGFLGYYIGGDVWVDVADFVARRTSGAPELGQMLATAWVRLTDPWGLVSIGSVVFTSVLGFNLIGEGLRLRLSPEMQIHRFRWLSETTSKIRLNIAEIWYPIGNFLFGSRFAVTAWLLLISSAMGYSAISAWQAGVFKLPEAQPNMFWDERIVVTEPSAVDNSGEAAQENGEDAGSQTISAEPIGETNITVGSDFTLPTENIPLTDPVTVWTLENESGFEGNPAVDSEGNVYVASLDGEVYAVHPDGTILWQQTLEPAPNFSPSISPDGILYIPDSEAGLTALSLDGTMLWRYAQPEEGFRAVSQVTIGKNGLLYYTVSRGTSGQVQALTSDGRSAWLTRANTPKFFRQPNLSATEEFVFLAKDIFDSQSGEIISLDSEFAYETFFVGENGKDYMLSGSVIFEWQRSGDALEVLHTVRAAGHGESDFGVRSPLHVFVTADETFVFVFTGFVLWENAEGELLHEAVTEDRLFLRMPLSLEEDLSVLACGTISIRFGPGTQTCLPLSPFGEETRWQLKFVEADSFVDTLAGVSRTPTGFALASRTGAVFGVMENQIAQALAEKQVQADLEGAAITSTGSGWIFNTPENLLVPPLIHENGSVYLLTVENTFYVLDQEGSVQHVLTLPEPIYTLEERIWGGGTIDTPFPPILTPDGGIVVASDTRLYAMSLDGTIAWDIPLDDEPHSPPTSGFVENTFYLLDKQGSLYAFSPAEGLQWKHALEEGLRPAFFFPVFSSTGEVFYSITNGTRGQIEALAPDGTQLWRTMLTTFNFFRPIQITPAGDWISVDDNVVRASTGELVELADSEFPVDQFAMGQDGKTYLLSGSTVMEWELIAGGRLNIVRQVTTAFPPNATRGFPPQLSVTEDGTIWIVFIQAGGRLIYNWVSFDGQMLNQIEVDRSDEFIIQENLGDVSLTFCSLERADSLLICHEYNRYQLEALWEITIEGIPRADNIQYRNGVLFIQTASDTIQTVNVELPIE